MSTISKCYSAATDFPVAPNLRLMQVQEAPGTFEPHLCDYCTFRFVTDPTYAPYCGPECSIDAEMEERRR